MRRHAVAGAFFAAVLLFTLAAFPAKADWPSPKDVLKKVAPLAGLNHDQVEFTLFSLEYPSCASTIVSYTMAQDYSLAVFIAGLKAAKLESVPSVPKMSHAQCKKYNPVQQAYIFINSSGDKLLGKSKADVLREVLKEQIEEGKSSLDAQIASIPYVGTVLTNWDCGCDAAYETNLQSEKTINETVRTVISIGSSVANGDIGSALEKMVVTLGPELACKLGADWTGVGAIPVVSTIASEACSSVAGKAVGWVVDAGSTTAEALGIIGGEHIPPDQYYKQMFMPELAKDGYPELAAVLYKKCYSYFEASNMAASTAKKVCTGLHARYIEESIGKIQWGQSQDELYSYYNKNVGPKAVEGAMLSDSEFAGVKQAVAESCRIYFSMKYPKATPYALAYGGEPIEDICPSFVTYSPSQYKGWDMDKARDKAQKQITYDVIAKHTPFCKKGDERNVVVCTSEANFECSKDLPHVCAKSAGPLGGWERPCCKLGSGTDNVFDSQASSAEALAKKAGGPFCTTSKSDPLRISCSLEEAQLACRKSKTQSGGLPECATVNKNPNGTHTAICCTYAPENLPKVDGVTKIKEFVNDQNAKSDKACGIGGMMAGFKYDPRIANCRSDVMQACKDAFNGGTCTKGDGGFVKSPCCDISVFASAPTEEKPVDPSEHSAEDLAMTAAIVKGSNGQCHYGETKDGKEDKFKVVCDTIAGAEQCVKTMGRPAQTPCSSKMAVNGYVKAPCCQRSSKALQAEGSERPKDVDAIGLGKGLGANAMDTYGSNMSKNKGGLDPKLGNEKKGLPAANKLKPATNTGMQRTSPSTSTRSAPPSTGRSTSGGLGSTRSSPTRADDPPPENYKP